eukprot:gnl/Dysnectes_brevis/5001_a6994_792.p1 GENE.gnl/Dysnectes_brevis/5001_a6994_792~~gnl/Dysnectes_brevis/5001_a6994_792.p1  ORF type:complete len:208 (+),score=54.14 gnl/Dysnectes_brevis/5001_a6994_792:69-692(+)
MDHLWDKFKPPFWYSEFKDYKGPEDTSSPLFTPPAPPTAGSKYESFGFVGLEQYTAPSPSILHLMDDLYHNGAEADYAELVNMDEVFTASDLLPTGSLIKDAIRKRVRSMLSWHLAHLENLVDPHKGLAADAPENIRFEQYHLVNLINICCLRSAAYRTHKQLGDRAKQYRQMALLLKQQRERIEQAEMAECTPSFSSTELPRDEGL